MMAGDCHGDVETVEYWCKQALKLDVTHIWVTGDLVYAPDIVQFLDRINRMLNRAGIQMLVTDGNHCPVCIYRAYTTGTIKGTHLMRTNIEFIDRGTILTLDGIRFMSFGGAVSHDKERQLMKEAETGVRTWFPEEAITVSETRQAITNVAETGPVDVMVTHEYPDGVDFSKIMLKVDYPEVLAQRRLIRRVVAVARPLVLYHGHHHLRYNDKLTIDGQEVLIRGLANGTKGRDSFLVFDTEEFRETIGLERHGTATTA